MKHAGILGAGRQAAETVEYLQEAGYSIDFFFVESKYADTESPLASIAPMRTEQDDLDEYKDTPVITAVGSPKLRKKMVELWPHSNYFSFVHKTAWVSKEATLGVDVTIPPQTVVNAFVNIADHVSLNIGCTISHDCSLGEYCTLSPGVHISGNVTVGKGTFFGTGSNIRNAVKLGPGSIIGMGAAVTVDVQESVEVVGVPAKVVKKLKEWY